MKKSMCTAKNLENSEICQEVNQSPCIPPTHRAS